MTSVTRVGSKQREGSKQTDRPETQTARIEGAPDSGLEWRDDASRDLLDAIVALPDRAAAERFFRDLCTLNELRDMAQRWHVVQLLEDGRHYLDISRETGASTATITRIAQWLRHGAGGYAEALTRGAGVRAAPRSKRATEP